LQQYGKAHSGGNDRNSKIKIVQVNNQLVVMGTRDSKQQWRQCHHIWALANAATGGKATINWRQWQQCQQAASVVASASAQHSELWPQPQQQTEILMQQSTGIDRSNSSGSLGG